MSQVSSGSHLGQFPQIVVQRSEQAAHERPFLPEAAGAFNNASPRCGTSVPTGSRLEKSHRVLDEELVVLEQGTVTRVWIEDERGVRKMLGQSV
jgi:hypothetical protein